MSVDMDTPLNIVGLGNPGSEYLFTRHNVGFMILDLLQQSYRWSFSRDTKLRARVCQGEINARSVVLVKPWQYMNRSGAVVRKLGLAQDEQTGVLGNLLVVFDDIHLPLGTIRYRQSGSHGGHNGVRSIIELNGTNSFHRLRIGIGSDVSVFDMSRYVLGNFTSAEEPVLKDVVQRAAESIEWYCVHGIESAMNKYNGIVT